MAVVERLAGSQAPEITSDEPTVNGWAIECRINAEDPFKNFTPASGILGIVSWPGETLDPSLGEPCHSYSTS